MGRASTLGSLGSAIYLDRLQNSKAVQLKSHRRRIARLPHQRGGHSTAPDPSSSATSLKAPILAFLPVSPAPHLSAFISAVLTIAVFTPLPTGVMLCVSCSSVSPSSNWCRRWTASSPL